MINFWHKNPHEYDDQGASVVMLPPTAKVQTGPSGEYPWASECERQVKELGTKALANHPITILAQTLRVRDTMLRADALRALVAHNVPPISFEARRRPQRHIEEPSITYINGGDLD